MRYPSHDQIVAGRIAAPRAQAVQALRQADARVRAAGGRLVVFGSLAEGGFDERSDIDVAILGVPAGPDRTLAVEVDTDLSLAGFACDVIPVAAGSACPYPFALPARSLARNASSVW